MKMLLDLLKFWWKPTGWNAFDVTKQIVKHVEVIPGGINYFSYCGCYLKREGEKTRLRHELDRARIEYHCCRAAGPPNRMATDPEGRKRENRQEISFRR